MDLLEVDVPDHKHPDQTQTHQTGPHRQHPGLRVSIGLLDTQPLGGVRCVAELGVQAVVDVGEVAQRVFRQVPLQGLFESVCPDGSGDGVADGPADVAHDVEECQHGGDVLMVRRREDTDLLDDDEDGPADADEDLTHDDVPDVLVRAAKVDHQALGEDVQRDGDEQHPPKVPGLADQDAHEEQLDTGDDVERAAHVTRLRDGQIVHHLQERGEVAVPAVVADLVREVQETGTDDGAVDEQADVQKGCACDEGFV